MRKVLSIFILFISSSIFCQTPVQKGLEKYGNELHPEKIFIHSDKSFYAKGETIWMAIYLVDGMTHTLGTLSKVIKVELRDFNGKIIEKLNLFSDQGIANASIKIPTSLISGNYQLVAYTNYQRNTDEAFFFRKNIKILPGIITENSSKKIEEPFTINKESQPSAPAIQFFPEGGDCIDGIPCKVAYVVKRHQHKATIGGIGKLVNQNGKKITTITADEYGYGKFIYLPQKDNPAAVVFNNSEEKFKLPKVQKEGYHLNVKVEEDTVRILVKTNISKGINNVSILLHSRGQYEYEANINTSRKYIWLKFSKKELPEGIIVCTLFDQYNQPFAERLFFNPLSSSSTQISIETDSIIYGFRKKTPIKIQIPRIGQNSDSPTTSNISIGIVPTFAIDDLESEDIRTWLLLNSDLENPIPYLPKIFDKEEAIRNKTIDDILLTRGWRRFKWEAIFNKKPSPTYFAIEEGIYLKGSMTKLENPTAPRPGKVFFQQLEDGIQTETMTDVRGNFTFGPIELFDTTTVYLQGRFKLGRRNRLNPKITLNNNRNTKLSILEDAPPQVSFRYLPNKPSSTATLDAYKKLSNDALTIAKNYDSLSIILDEVQIKAKRISTLKKRREERTLIYSNPSNRIVIDSVPFLKNSLSVFDILRRLPGIRIIGSSLGGEQILVRGVSSILGGTSPLFMIDGFPVEEEFFRNFPVGDIEFIDLLKGNETAIYGARGANGVILLYTRTGYGESIKKPTPGMLKVQLIGFHRAREFGVFDPNASGNHNRPDIRTTLHWNPNIVIDENGLVEEIFKTSDQKGRFIIVAQGMTGNGIPLFGKAVFEVEE